MVLLKRQFNISTYITKLQDSSKRALEIFTKPYKNTIIDKIKQEINKVTIITHSFHRDHPRSLGISQSNRGGRVCNFVTSCVRLLASSDYRRNVIHSA